MKYVYSKVYINFINILFLMCGVIKNKIKYVVLLIDKLLYSN